MTAREWGTSRPPGELARSVSIRGDHNVTTNIVIDQNAEDACGSFESRVEREATVFASIFVGLIVVGALHLWFYAVAAVLAIGFAYMVIKWGERRHRLISVELRRRAEIVERADQQHRWVCEGDPRGTFGVDR